MCESTLSIQRESLSVSDPLNCRINTAGVAQPRSRSKLPTQLQVNLARPDGNGSPSKRERMFSPHGRALRRDQQDRTPLKRSAQKSSVSSLTAEQGQGGQSGLRGASACNSPLPELDSCSASSFDMLPPTPATSRRSQLQQQSSSNGRQRFEAFRRVKLTAMLEGCARLDVDFEGSGVEQLEVFMRNAVSAAKGELIGSTEEVSSCRETTSFAQLLCSMAPTLLAVDSNFVDLAFQLPELAPEIQQRRTAMAVTGQGQTLFALFLSKYYRPALFSIVAAADMSETLALAKEELLFARAQSRTNDSNEHYYKAWQAANNTRLERLSSCGQCSEPSRLTTGDLADCIDVDPDSSPLERNSISSVLSGAHDPNRDYIEAAKATVKAVERAAQAAKESQIAVSRLQAFLRDHIGSLPEEQMANFLAAWRGYVNDAALFVRLCAVESHSRIPHGETESDRVRWSPQSGSLRRLPISSPREFLML